MVTMNRVEVRMTLFMGWLAFTEEAGGLDHSYLGSIHCVETKAA